ncbi:MAG TPA: bifunctional [glutamate--ammonia ligase]-adenylyl-L-tyrosine phosphorylase/[glutamate--ammonia-ligase] adenylyltransferase, partial [Burkholderiaceae bacterium]|nr:bifunctional [glutamate--ammonia ligase]-adenylyl-L-tyrosine phosphorylase/[glutamate--ammonia-ligase] adenylyltransferase [Burkholderiaceae bacterium]
MENGVRSIEQSLAAAGEAVLALTHFVPRALAAALGAEASAREQVHWLVQRAAEPWTELRIRQTLDDLLAANRSGAAGSEQDVDALASALRKLRRDVVIGTLVRDVARVADLDEVMLAMTTLAEVAVQAALSAHTRRLRKRHGVPLNRAGKPLDLLVVAMGKGGGQELNVSSDLDLVFVYDEDGQTQAQPDTEGRCMSHHEFFERLGRGLIQLLAEVTADGFVFRVDMRLRPHGDSGPLAVSNAMLEAYLVRDGRTWERFAWLKGRVISAAVLSDAQGFAQQVDALYGVVRPFVFRKYLDFNAIAALRELHAKIRAETNRKAAARSGEQLNVKLGRGGIREIEFIAQTFQIMRGGREPSLAAVARSTRETLAKLPDIGSLSEQVCEQLDAGYEFLRRLEHALQYVDDAQTHTIAQTPEDQARIAQLMGMPSGEAMMAHYKVVSEFVAARFDDVFRIQSDDADGDDAVFTPERFTETLRTLGFAEPDDTAERVTLSLGGRRISSCPEASRRLIEALLMQAARVIAQSQSAVSEQTHEIADFVDAGLRFDDILIRFVRLVDTVAGRSTYLALLTQYPQALARVLSLLEASGWATDYLLAHPILLDELLGESSFDGVEDLSQ